MRIQRWLQPVASAVSTGQNPWGLGKASGGAKPTATWGLSFAIKLLLPFFT